jgi:D-beta-D-heptose 7-phosphate kinase/D-beta-D-heptose 1-phosphate adenosyltransferase
MSRFLTSKKPRIAVFGDLMIDKNVYVHATKIANEAPIPVFHHQSEECALGGAGNVLKNLAALGTDQLFAFGFVGEDAHGTILRQLLKDLKIDDRTVALPDVPTIVKQRYFCDNKIVFRTDMEGPVRSSPDAALFYKSVKDLFSTTPLDCVVLSDYNKGFLNHERCHVIISLARQYGIPTVVDPKEDYNKYVGCTLIKPNKREAHKLFHIAPNTAMNDVHALIRKTIDCKYSVVTLAEEGISVGTPDTTLTARTAVQHIVDVTGAGDIVTTIFAYFLQSAHEIGVIADLATKIATKSVGTPGTYTIKPQDIYECELQHQIQVRNDQVQLLRQLYSDKKVVFTNGCFDLLHSGHLELLRFCKSKGDIVVVGLNSDASVHRLKGPSRPIQSEHIRADVLGSLGCVDHVVIFEEDTPFELLRNLRPDVLIKGGDYKIESIIGREFAKETLVCALVEGLSTTNTVKKIQSQ